MHAYKELIRWGSDGLAFHTSGNQVFFFRTPSMHPYPTDNPTFTTRPDGVRKFSLAANDIVYNPVDQLIYATVPSASGGIGNSMGGGGMFSDRNLKENVAAVDNQAILDRVAQLPIREWNYKQQDASIRHIGPMAQDFAATFGVGEDDRRINPVDANGVTLASIQALYALNQKQAEQIAALQKQIETLQKAQAAPVAAPDKQ